MNVALIQNAQHDIHRRECRENQHRFALERILESLRGSLKARMNRRGHGARVLDVVNRLHRITQRNPRREIERERHRRKLPLVRDRQ